MRHQLTIRNNNQYVNRTQGSAECQNEVRGLWESSIRPKARAHTQPLNHTASLLLRKNLLIDRIGDQETISYWVLMDW